MNDEELVRDDDSEPATKRDLRKVQRALLTEIDGTDKRLGAKIDAVDAKLTDKIDALDVKVGARIDSLDVKVDSLHAGKRRFWNLLN